MSDADADVSRADSQQGKANPYQSPAEPVGQTPFGEQAPGTAVTPGVIELLRQTRPWVRFMSIMGFIGAGFMLLAGTAGLIFAVMTVEFLPVIMMIMYIVMGLMYLGPAVLLFRYANRISDLEVFREPEHLEAALEAQRSFWRFVGILMIVILVGYALMVVGMIVFTFVANVG